MMLFSDIVGYLKGYNNDPQVSHSDSYQYDPGG